MCSPTDVSEENLASFYKVEVQDNKKQEKHAKNTIPHILNRKTDMNLMTAVFFVWAPLLHWNHSAYLVHICPDSVHIKIQALKIGPSLYTFAPVDMYTQALLLYVPTAAVQLQAAVANGEVVILPYVTSGGALQEGGTSDGGRRMGW